MSERPGGFAPTHRRVRRQEEIIWLRAQGFTEIVSLLASPHNLQAYEDQHIAHAHFPLAPGSDPRAMLTSCYLDLEAGLRGSERILVHAEELDERVMGVAAGFLVWSGRVATGPQAIALVEQLVGHQMRAKGRELVVLAEALPRTVGESAAGLPSTPPLPAAEPGVGDG